MGQRVNIQYSIDLEDLPGEMEGLIAKAEHKLGECHKDIETLIKSSTHGTIMTTGCTNEIGEVREGLADVDFILNDIVTIIHSYVEYKIKTHQEHPTTSENDVATPELTDVDFENRLDEQVQAFKESLK
jgi:hypothetical protein